jgi:hypothetical protein
MAKQFREFATQEIAKPKTTTQAARASTARLSLATPPTPAKTVPHKPEGRSTLLRSGL